MGTSQAQKAESRERILAAASRQIREGGLGSLSIAELMKTAGLTHGAFYAHFPSRSALIAAAVARALEDGERAAFKAHGSRNGRTLQSVVDSYLSPTHRDAPHKGCAVPSLATDTMRAGEEAQRAMRDRVAAFIDDLAEAIGTPDAREQAMAAWSTMVGALTLSRVFEGDALSDEILASARHAILSKAR
jgi:TetR/AcrR family transcriptional repressor of nem operon